MEPGPAGHTADSSRIRSDAGANAAARVARIVLAFPLQGEHAGLSSKLMLERSDMQSKLTPIPKKLPR